MKHFFLTVLLLFLAIQQIKPAGTTPRLILFIVIDELDNEQLLMLQPAFSNRGFNRISHEGLRFISVSSHDFSGFPGTRMASLYTGSSPATHGIIGEQWYDYRSGEPSVPVSYDPSHIKHNTNYNQSRSLADYFKSIYGPGSRSAALTINAPWMIHSLGHNPDAFLAFDVEAGIFYNALDRTNSSVSWLNDFNDKLIRTERLKRQWGPLHDITTYTEFRYISEEKKSDFRSFLYNMNNSVNKKFEKLAASPFANTLLRDLTVAFVANSDFGKNESPDILSVCFTTRSFTKTNGTILPAEKEDMLLRLDQDIASLIEFLDFELGRSNYLIVLTSAANSALDMNSFGKQGLTSGIFEGDKITALLNLYLMALHGQGRWVLGFRDGAFYLNRKLIDERQLNLREIQDIASSFLTEVSGVARAKPIRDLHGEMPTELFFTHNYVPRRTGDIHIALLPGWQTPVTVSGSRQTGFSGHNKVPLMMRGWELEQGAWFQDISLQQIIPMVLKTMELSFPTEMEIPEIKTKNR